MARDYPLLYVSNPTVLRQDRNTNAGGSKTDFFADRDQAFAALRTHITTRLETVRSQLQDNAQRFCSSGFVKVRLQEKAWAKTHRPVRKLFTDDNAPVVAGDDIGELVVRATPAGLGRVIESVGKADKDTSRRRDNHGKLVPNPNRERSEVGALEDLRLWSEEDRRLPNAKDAVAVFERFGLAPMYAVRFFDPILAALQKAKPASGRVAWQDSPADSFVASLVELGRKLGIYVVVERELDIMSHAYVGLVDSPGFAILDGFARLDQVGEQLKVDGDFSLDAHKELLHLLGEHPNVRSVAVPSVLFADRISTLEAAAAGQRIQRRSTVISLTPAKLPPPAKGASYPTVAVVDGGIAAKFRPWIKGTYGDIPEDERDLEHGTNIAGLLVAAQSLNSGYVQRFEEDGCWLIDIAIHPTDEYAGDYYENGSAKFLDALESIVAQCKAEHGVRVFNFSLNNRTDVLPNQFSDEGMRLDAIARRHDVFFVISAGNAKEADARPQWDSRPFSAALQLSEVRTDTLWGPADSLVNVSVGATNGAGVQGCIVDAPARYSRRGPGVRGSIKPDVCHIGGADRDGDPNTGLMSVSKEGMLAAVKGTSMAAPLAAKTLAALDLEMGGHAPREVVQAVYLHNTYFAPPLTGMQAKRTARHLVGFGYPRPSAQTLQLDRHTFGVVVHDSLHVNDNTIIDFRWPRELVDEEGRCRGTARLTLVYSPPLDFDFGAEAARVSLDPSLRQRKVNGKADDDEDLDDDGDEDKAGWVGRLRPLHASGLKRTSREAALLLDGMKWSPVKLLEGNLRGVGRSPEWRLSINYVARDQVQFPDEGVPFAVVLTITDPQKEANVYDDLQQELVATSSVKLNDIRTALRVRPQAR